MRKLVSIQKVKEIIPIEGAEAIEAIRVLGWVIVVKKGEFKVGEKVIYAEVDSVFPKKPEFEFLEKVNYRIKTIKLRGQVSQGICFPLSILPEGEYEEDQDVTELLGVIKYEPKIPDCLAGEVRGNFPGFLKKTDETRVQVLQNILTKYKGLRCYYTEKVDGTSSTFYLNDGVFGVCSRNLDLKENESNILWKVARENDLENKLRNLGLGNVAVQGEVISDGIQGNKYKLSPGERRLYLFNVFDIDNHRYLGYEDLIRVSKALNIPTAPILVIDFELIDNIDELVKLSVGFSVINPKVKREGIVIRPIEEIEDIRIGRLSFKAINPEFLLKYKDE